MSEIRNDSFSAEVTDQRTDVANIMANWAFVNGTNGSGREGLVETDRLKEVDELSEIFAKTLPTTIAEPEKIDLVNNLVPVAFLATGAKISNAVGRMLLASGGAGTGTLISSDLALTNNHVIGSSGEANGAVMEFHYERDAGGQPRMSIRRRVLELVTTDKRLDYSVVRVEGDPGDEFGFVDIESPATPLTSHPTNGYPIIVQHPNGGPKRIALTDNHVLGIRPPFFHYSTDTQPGSSGSMVFNHDWVPMGLHHAGRFTGIGRSGRRKAENEGILLSVILAGLRSKGIVGKVSEVYRVIEPLLQNPASLPRSRAELGLAWFYGSGLQTAIISDAKNDFEIVPLIAAAVGFAAGAGAAHLAHVTSKERWSNELMAITLDFSTLEKLTPNIKPITFEMQSDASAYQLFETAYPIIRTPDYLTTMRYLIKSDKEMHPATHEVAGLAAAFLAGVAAGAAAYKAGK